MRELIGVVLMLIALSMAFSIATKRDLGSVLLSGESPIEVLRAAPRD